MKPHDRSGFYLAEFRADDATGTISGYAALFNTPTDIGWGWRETIAPGAFTKTLADKADIRALFNHNPDLVLGRTTAGTLTVTEDERGLKYEISPQDTSFGKDLYTSIKRGDITQSSFAFRVIREDWKFNQAPVLDERTILEAELFDVSPVTYPATDSTTVVARNMPVANTAGERRTVDEIIAEWKTGQIVSAPIVAARTTQDDTPDSGLDDGQGGEHHLSTAPDVDRERIKRESLKRERQLQEKVNYENS